MALPSARPATVVIMKCRNIDFSSVIQATGRKNSVVTCKLSKEEKLLLEKSSECFSPYLQVSPFLMLFPQPLVLVFGNEVNNLEDEWGGVVTDENVGYSSCSSV